MTRADLLARKDAPHDRPILAWDDGDQEWVIARFEGGEFRHVPGYWPVPFAVWAKLPADPPARTAAALRALRRPA